MSLGDAFKSFWHNMTSYDRHSNHDSPYRTGRHVPLDSARGLTSVTTGFESRHDLSYHDERNLDFDSRPPFSPSSPGGGSYSPGLRSHAARTNGEGFEVQSPGDVPMQAFHDGQPPPPPVSHSWRRIDAWTEENYPELYDQICEGATQNDMNDLEHQLDSTLPSDIRESWMWHDGQERGGLPSGLLFGNMLLDCEEIVQEWENWRIVNAEFLERQRTMPVPAAVTPQSPDLAADSENTKDNGEGSSKTASPQQTPRNPNWRQDLIARQDSVPSGSIQRAYAHPAWIPLVRDWGGNNLAVDLHPGPTGHWGQIILFGRDYDTKYVVARSWAHLLATFADDLNSGKWYIDEDSLELKLREFKSTRVEPRYFDILRWRMDQKYGRRAANRKSMAPPGARGPSLSANVSTHTSPTASPYMSPIADGGATDNLRGRPLQRLSVGTSPLASPNRPAFGKPSPLARVTEEKDGASSPSLGKSITGSTPVTAAASPQLMEMESPVMVTDVKKKNKLVAQVDDSATATSKSSATSSEDASSEESETEVADKKKAAKKEDEMKDIEI